MLSENRVPGSPDWRFYDHRGDFVAYCKCDQTSGRVSFVNYLRGGGVYRRETYDCRGFLSKVDLIFKKEVGEEVHELYLRPNGSIGILKEAHVENGVATVKSIQITDAQGRVFVISSQRSNGLNIGWICWLRRTDVACL